MMYVKHFFTIFCEMTKLKQILIERGISQAELAREAGKNSGTVNKICGNKQIPSPTMKHALLHALNNLLKQKKIDFVYKVDDIF